MSSFSYVLLLCIILLAPTGHAQSGKSWGSGIDFTQRAANREKGRWSLSEWLDMKNRNRMMDMWLSVNSPSPFEFMIGANYRDFRTENSSLVTEEKFNSYQGELAAYAQLVGIGVEYENNTEEGYNQLAGMVNLRLLGNSIQNTSLTLHLGQNSLSSAGTHIKQEFGQVSLQLYLMRYFGIDGRYRHYLAKDYGPTGELDGSLTEVGLFIDFNAFRIYGNWFQNIQNTKIPAAIDPSKIERTGIKTGFKIFF